MNRSILLYQNGIYAVATWKDTSHQEQRLVSKKGRRETYEWVDVVQGYWETDADVYDPTHWCELMPPELKHHPEPDTQERI